MSIVSQPSPTTNAAATFSPFVSSPLARTASPFTDPRTPPRSPRDTARLWDEYERRALEKAKSRDATLTYGVLRTPDSGRFSSGTVSDIIGSYHGDPNSSPRVPFPSPVSSPAPSPKFEFGFYQAIQQANDSRSETGSEGIAICKLCKLSIDSSTGICTTCKKSIVLPSKDTPLPLSPSQRNFASADLPKLQKQHTKQHLTSSKRKKPTRQSGEEELQELPIRLSSLRQPLEWTIPFRPQPLDSSSLQPELPRPRKPSLTDPNEPLLRVARKPLPTSPNGPLTILPSTPPGTGTSATPSRTRPSSLANVTTPPDYTSRHASATPSELSALYAYPTGSSSTPVCRASYNLQNNISVWEDDDEDDEKAGLVRYWRGRWRGSKTSFLGRRGSAVPERGVEGRAQGAGRLARALSCGCCGGEEGR